MHQPVNTVIFQIPAESRKSTTALEQSERIIIHQASS
jgi:hypothetical protein